MSKTLRGWLPSGPRQTALNFVRRQHGERWAAFAASGCEKFLRAYYNEGHWDMANNGEMLLMRAYAETANGNSVVLDVGAHEGDWTRSLLALCPGGQVIAFEILPVIREKLARRFQDDPRVRIAEFGLSDRSDTITVTWNQSCDSTNSIAPVLEGPFYRSAELVAVPCKVCRGDEYLSANAIGPVGFLKIDTEGHERNVLSGFSQTLAGKNAPRLIQFEYGTTYLGGRNRLQDIYELLTPCGYLIGRVYPKGVEFRAYEMSDENFRMGNYVAVKKDDPLCGKIALRGIVNQDSP
jgi:FkbM family methyltransferase